MKAFNEIFTEKKPIIGVLHLKGSDETDIKTRALREISLYKEGGVDAIIVEDYFGTYPYLCWALETLQKMKLPLPYGVNCLNFDSLCFKLARDYRCDFLQLDSVVGHVKPRDEATLDAFFALERPACDACVMGGVRFKYQPVLSEHSVEEDIETAKGRCDAICVTGDATGMEAPIDKIRRFKAACGTTPLIVCSGMTEDNCTEQLMVADGAVVGSFFKDSGKDTGDVCAEKISRLMTRVRALRKSV